MYNLFNNIEEEEHADTPEKEKEETNAVNQKLVGNCHKESEVEGEGIPRETSFISEPDVSMESASRNYSRTDTPSHLPADKGSPSKEMVNKNIAIIQKKEDTPEFKMSGSFNNPLNPKERIPTFIQV